MRKHAFVAGMLVGLLSIVGVTTIGAAAVMSCEKIIDDEATVDSPRFVVFGCVGRAFSIQVKTYIGNMK